MFSENVLVMWPSSRPFQYKKVVSVVFQGRIICPILIKLCTSVSIGVALPWYILLLRDLFATPPLRKWYHFQKRLFLDLWCHCLCFWTPIFLWNYEFIQCLSLSDHLVLIDFLFIRYSTFKAEQQIAFHHCNLSN